MRRRAGLTLADKQAINRDLLASGATISEMNCVRKASLVDQGRPAAARGPARMSTLGDQRCAGRRSGGDHVGPPMPDPTTFADARAIVARYGIEPSPGVAVRLAEDVDETPKPGELPGRDFT